MKALKQLAAGWFFVAFVLFSACSDEDDLRLQLSSTSCTFGASGGDQTISVVASGFDWDILVQGGDAEWFTVTKKVDGILIHAPRNTDLSVKKTTVEIKGEVNATIDIIQESGLETTLALIPSDEAFGFDSYGGSLTLSVSSNYPWTVDSDADWCELVIHKETNTFTLSAGENNGDKRTARITVSAGLEDNVKTVTFTLTQYTVAENPYLAMVGNWDLYSNQWVLGGQNIAAGSYVSFTIQEGVVKDTYVIRDLILNGMELEVYYNPEDGSMNIPLGSFVGMSTNGLYACYLCATNMTTGSVKSTMVTGTISEDYNTITLKGFEAGFGLGIIGKDGSSLASFSDLYYAAGSEITFKKQPAGNQAMDRYFVIPVKKRISGQSASLSGEMTSVFSVH
ncbi:BACON domain-containing protein [Odoribacter laneus]|uniref:BACON domain-containing protein n=1 Tax=Odoribacter laneus TaxID=626933 RepID=UPI003AF5D7AB